MQKSKAITLPYTALELYISLCLIWRIPLNPSTLSWNAVQYAGRLTLGAGRYGLGVRSWGLN